MTRQTPADPLIGLKPRVRARVEEMAMIGLEEGRAWDVKLAEELMAKWAVGKTTIYSYRKHMLQMYAQDLQEKREELRAEFLSRVHAAQAGAAGERRLAGLLGIEARVSGFLEPPPPPKGVDVSDEPMTEQEAISQLADFPVHLLEAALAIARAKGAR